MRWTVRGGQHFRTDCCGSPHLPCTWAPSLLPPHPPPRKHTHTHAHTHHTHTHVPPPPPPSHCRYEHALSKANYASLALRPEAKPEEEGEELAGLDEDEDLYQSLNK